MRVGQFTKRVVDIVLGTAMFAVCAPLMILIALLVKLTSKGPVFYRHRRLGPICPDSGRRIVFSVYKFRTTTGIGENIAGNGALPKCDFQITPVGKLLRVTRLDILPHLISVLTGDLSIFGAGTDDTELTVSVGR